MWEYLAQFATNICQAFSLVGDDPNPPTHTHPPMDVDEKEAAATYAQLERTAYT